MKLLKIKIKWLIKNPILTEKNKFSPILNNLIKQK